MHSSTRPAATGFGSLLSAIICMAALASAPAFAQESDADSGIQEFSYQMERKSSGRSADFRKSISILENAHNNSGGDDNVKGYLIRALAAEGAELFASGDFNGSLTRYRAALALTPGTETAMAVLAEIDARTQLEMLVRGDDFERVIKEFDEIRKESGARPMVADSASSQRAGDLVREMGTAQPERRWEIQQALLGLGELSVAHLLPLLRNQRDDTERSYAITTLNRMRGDAVLPIIEGMESDSEFQRLNVAIVLENISDPRSLAALQRAIEDPRESGRVKSQARKAMSGILAGSGAGARAAEFYWRKSLDYYHAKEAILRSVDSEWIVWRWSASAMNVVGEDVPQYAYNERLAEEALIDLLNLPLEDAARRSALGLLVSTYINQYQEASGLAEMHADAGGEDLGGSSEAADALRQAIFLSQACGDDLLGDVIVRAVSDGYAHTANGAIDALVAIDGEVGALSPALVASDKRVRYRAATASLALNSSGQPFKNIEYVVPNLVDALSEVGVWAILVIEGDTAARNRQIAALRELNLNAYGAASGLRGLARATQYPKADLILVSDNLEDIDSRTVCGRLARDFRTAGTPIAILSDQDKVGMNDADFVSSNLASRVLVRGGNSSLLKAELDAILEKSARMDAGRRDANRAAMDAAQALSMLDPTSTHYPVLQSVPGLLTSVEQQGDEVRIPALNALRKFGDGSAVRVVHAVLTADNSSVPAKCAAAEALGSILARTGNVPTETIDLLASLLSNRETDAALRSSVGVALGEAPLSPSQRIKLLRENLLHPIGE